MSSWITEPKLREIRGPFPHAVLLVMFQVITVLCLIFAVVNKKVLNTVGRSCQSVVLSLFTLNIALPYVTNQ